MNKRAYILAKLQAGGFVSGEELGAQLGVSRAAVAKHIKQLQALGVDIHRVTGKGYRLAAPMSLLQHDAIEAAYREFSQRPVAFSCHFELDSTNTELLRQAQSKQLSAIPNVVVAEAQTAGRGRRGKSWLSPLGSNLYFSYAFVLEEGLQALMGMSIVAGIAVSTCLEDVFNIPTKLKWPNDIYADGKKLGGILVEVDGQPTGPVTVVIGIGLNLRLPEAAQQAITQPSIDLHTLGATPNKNNLVAALTHHLNQFIAIKQTQGMAALLPLWQERDAFLGQSVVLSTGQSQWQGVCEGIDSQGGIVLRMDGEQKSYYGGEISLRQAK